MGFVTYIWYDTLRFVDGPISATMISRCHLIACPLKQSCHAYLCFERFLFISCRLHTLSAIKQPRADFNCFRFRRAYTDDFGVKDLELPVMKKMPGTSIRLFETSDYYFRVIFCISFILVTWRCHCRVNLPMFSAFDNVSRCLLREMIDMLPRW